MICKQNRGPGGSEGTFLTRTQLGQCTCWILGKDGPASTITQLIPPNKLLKLQALWLGSRRGL